MMPDLVTDGSGGKPDWRRRAVRCGLEVTLIVLSTTYLVLQVEVTALAGLILAAGLFAAVVVLFWCVDDLAVDWVRYASTQARRRRKRQRRKRQKRQQMRERHDTGDGDDSE